MGTLGSSRISEAALIEPAASVPEELLADPDISEPA